VLNALIITISGTPGSEKGEIADRIAKKLEMDPFSIEKDFVEPMAHRRRMSVSQFYVAYADKIDEPFDDWQRNLCNYMDGIVLESLLGFQWAKKSKIKSYNVFVTSDKEIAAERLLKIKHEEARGKNKKQMIKNLEEREKFEIENYREKYKIEDFTSPENFDLVLDTSKGIKGPYMKLLNRVKPLLEEEEKAFNDLVNRFPMESREKEYTYISTPHSTGKLMYDYLIKNNLKKLEKGNPVHEIIREEILSKNEASSKTLKNNLTKLYGPYVINPTEVGYFGNTPQRKGLALWRKFIRKYVKRMVMNEGWEYSNGCVEEFFLANAEQIELLDHKLQPINVRQSSYDIVGAIKDVKSLELPCEKLEFFYSMIGKYALNF